MLTSRQLAIKAGKGGVCNARPTFNLPKACEILQGDLVFRNIRSKISAFSTGTNPNSPIKPLAVSDLSFEEENNSDETPEIDTEDSSEIRLRVAIVGGGAAGLSTALHLAPLAAAGIISSPVHIYESKKREGDSAWTKTNNDDSSNPGCGPYGRDIGVGIWSSALLSFAKNSSSRESHHEFLQHIQEKGRWVNNVGYRTPDGSWLAKSNLACGPSLLEEVGAQDEDEIKKNKNVNDPALLFLTEKELITALRNAVKYEEEEYSTIQTHYASKDSCNNSTVEGVLAHYDKNGDEVGSSLGLGRLVFANGSMSKGMYHVIVDASGTNSRLRTRYGSEFHSSKKSRNRRKARNIIPNESSSSIENREYSIFRGTSPLLDEETGMKGISFQTWGESDSMRFATVPMQSGQAWFVTTSDPRFRLKNDINNNDRNNEPLSSPLSSEERKQIIINSIKDWHDPIISLIESTPANEIIMENAIAHQFSMGPVLSLHNHDSSGVKTRSQTRQLETSTSERKRKQRYEDEVIGRGPILCFVGDANMTVDPVLAQGFTMAMEDASSLSATIKKSCIQKQDENLSESKSASSRTGNQHDLHNLQSSYNVTSSGLSTMRENLKFNPRKLRTLLAKQYVQTYEPRLLCLLRATELVQMLAQPPSTFTLAGGLSKYVVRPSMKYMPNMIKKPIFDFMVRYSLGLAGGKRKKD